MKLKNIKWLTKKEIKYLLALWEKQFGIDNIEENINKYAFFITSKNKVYIINREISEHINDLVEYNINSIGLYIGEQYDEDNFRFNIEGSNIFAKSAKKNILTLHNTYIRQWISGNDLVLSDFKDKIKNYGHSNFILIKNKKGDLFGCGKININKDMIMNYIPKSRRIKNLDVQ